MPARIPSSTPPGSTKNRWSASCATWSRSPRSRPRKGPSSSGSRRKWKPTGAFDKIWTDGLGNLLGQVGKPGKGKKLIAIDAHVDTVGVGERSEWKHDPYKGKVADGKVWGRGAGDQEGAIPAMVYAAKILRDLKVDMSEFSLLLTFTVMEEDCDGLCWQYIVQRRQDSAGCRRRHRFDRLQNPPRPARPDGDRRHLPRQVVPRLDAREGRQRGLQNRQGRARDRSTQRAAQGRRVPRQGHDHRQLHRLQNAEPVRRARARRTSISIAGSPSATRRSRPSPK